MAILYVSATGNSAATGLDPANPTTLTHASSLSAPGDIIKLFGGAYALAATFYPAHNGTADNWIVYENYDSTPPIFTWTGGAAAPDLNMIHPFNSGTDPSAGTPKAYIEFRGFYLDGNNAAAYGIHPQACHHLRFINNRVYNMTRGGIATSFCDYIYSEGNLITHVGYNLGESSCISYNRCQYYDHAPGFHSYVLNNIVSGAYDPAFHADGNGIIMDLSTESSRNLATADNPAVLIANNVCFENGGDGILLLSVANIWVVNNTCYSNALDTATTNFSQLDTSSSKNSYFVNNIAYSWNSRVAIHQTTPNSNIAYYSNLYFAGTVNFTPSDPSQFINADPDFVSPPPLNPTAGGQYATALAPWDLGTDLELQDGSPAIQVGTDPTTIPGLSAEIIAGLQTYCFADINGVPRPQGGYFGLGAYETILPFTPAPPKGLVGLKPPAFLGGPAFGKPRMFPQPLVPATPVVRSATPATAAQGATLDVVLGGGNFENGDVVTFGTGITVNTTTVTNSTSLTVNITVAAGATVGTYTITVTNRNGQFSSLVAGFTVTATAPAPTVTSATANTGIQGQTLSIVVAGADFVATPTVSFGAGITINSVTFTNSSHLTVGITITPTATPGTRTVTVTNPDLQVGSAAAAFTVTAAAPTVTSSTPSVGAQGETITSVIVGGTFFVATPTVSFGAGITVNSVTFNSSTQLTVSITIAGAATVGVRTITVTNPDTQSGTLVAGFTVRLPAPTVSSATANTGAQGATLTVTVAGTGFVSTPTVSFGAAITINSVTFTNSTHVDVNITIASNAAVGVRTITVTNPDTQSGSLASAFTVTAFVAAPTVSSVSPSSGVQGQALTGVVIVGTGFNATPPSVSFGSGVTVTQVTFTDTTHLSVNLAIDTNATIGARTVTVTNPDNQSGSLVSGFTVIALAPVPTSISPTSGTQGQTMSVGIVGTGFISTPTVSLGSGITVNSVTFVDAQNLTASITIAGGATTGTRTLTVTNPDTQVGTLASAFTVIGAAAAPTVSSVTANTGAQGATLPAVVIVGTDFVATPTVSFGTGITVNSVTFTNSTHLSVSITIASNADVGTRTVTVTNPDFQVGSLAAAFTVTAPLPAPTVTSSTPSTGGQGQALSSVTIVGTNFVATPTVSYGADITVSSVTFTNSTHLSVNIIIASNAALGARTVTVTNPDSQSGSASAFTVTGITPPPTVSGTNPNTANQGTTSDIVVIGTGFSATPTVSFGAGITVNTVTLTDAQHLTVNVTIDAAATSGARTVTVTNPDLQVGSLASAFTVTTAPPTVTSVSPSDGIQGLTITNVIVGGTFFTMTPTVSFGSGITINSVTFDSSTQLTVSITITGAAALGTRTVIVENPDTQTGSLVDGFTVEGPGVPTVTGASPSIGTPGQTITSLTVTGTGFVATPTVSFGLGITVNSVTFVASTQLTVSITIAADASVGGRTITVTNPDTISGSLAAGFTVVTSSSPGFVNDTSATGTNVSSLTVTTPGSLVAGNVLIWIISRVQDSSGAPLTSPPSGWTWLTDATWEDIDATTNQHKVLSFYRVVDGTEAANYTVDFGTTCKIIIGEMGQYDGVNPTAPIYSQQGIEGEFGSSDAIDSFFFDQVGFDAGVIAPAFQVNYLSVPVNETYAAPIGYTEQFTNATSGGGYALSVGIFNAPGYTDGLGDTATFTGTNTSSTYTCLRYFLRPASVAEPTIGWTRFETLVVPAFSNWPSLLLDSNNLYMYALYPTDPKGGTILQKFDTVARSSLLKVTLDAAVAPENDECLAQDDIYLYIGLADQKLRKVQKSDLTQVAISSAITDGGSLMGLSYNGPTLWSSEDSGEFFYQFNTTTLAHTSVDNGFTKLAIAFTTDDSGNGWALAYNTSVSPFGSLLISFSPSFATAEYDISADLPLVAGFLGQDTATIGFDPTTGYLWAASFVAEDTVISANLGKILVWDTVSHTTVATFTYGKTLKVTGSTMVNPLAIWNSTRSRWVAFSFYGGSVDLAFGTPGFADVVRFDQNGTFIEKLPIQAPALPGSDLLQELQSAVIVVNGSQQDIWMVLHADDAEGKCLKFIAVGAPSDIPPPPTPTTTCVSLFFVATQWFGTIDGTDLSTASQVIISPTDNIADPLAYDAPITSVSATAVTVSLPSLEVGEGFWFVVTDDGTTAGNNTLCFPPAPPTTTCIDLPSPVIQQPYGTIHGENLAGTYKVLITEINNVNDGNAYDAPILEVTDTEVTVFIPNHSIGQGYWWLFTTGGVVPEGIIQISSGNNQPCTPFSTSWWKTRKVWFESLEP